MKNIVYLLFTLFILCACKNTESVGTGLLMTGTEKNNIVKFAIDKLPSSYSVSVTSTKVVESDVEVSIEVDNSLVAEYNKENGANLFPLPEGAWELGSKKLKIPAGKSISSATTISIIDDSNFESGRTYVVPVTIKQSTGNPKVIESCRTIFLKISRTLHFNALDTKDWRMGYNFTVPNPVKDLPVYTWELKLFCDKLFSNDPSAYYVIANIAGGGKTFNLIRMETTRELVTKMRINILQTYLVSTTNFEENRWYHIALVNDGTTLTLYINGEKDCFTPVTPDNYPLETVQMSTPNLHPNSLFLGRLSEMRIWNKPLTSRELKAGVCGVDPQSDGLVSYWRMDEGEGSTLYDATSLKNDLIYKVPISWANDDYNTCIQ